MTGIINTMISIFVKDTELARGFLLGLIEEDNGDLLLECMLTSSDKDTRTHIGRLMKFLLCHLKMEEKDLILNNIQMEIIQP